MSSKVHSDISCETKEISQDDVQEIKNLIEERIFLSLQSDYKRCK